MNKLIAKERKSKEDTILYIVIPCYNEEEVLPHTTDEMIKCLKKHINNKNISKESKILYVDDGSKDKTWKGIKTFYNDTKYVEGIKLSRNKGHQNALHAGLMYAKDFCDISISIDADLQDDISVIDGFIEKYYEGNEIVYGVRDDRETDGKFKKITAEAFYKVMKILGVETINNHADCRLMSKMSLEKFSEYNEYNLYIRGMIPTIGYKTDIVSYRRNERFAGETKYPLSKMLNLAVDGITSFSAKPIRAVFNVGIIICFLSIVVFFYSIIRYFTGDTITGWTSTVLSIWFLGGIQLVAIGVVGEYIGKIYTEVKDRPKYFVEEILAHKNPWEK